jgi:hypothetical protein
MPTSPKRTNRRRKIRFPVLVLGICLVCAVLLLTAGLILRACGPKDQDHPGTESDISDAAASETAVPVQAENGTYTQFVGHKVIVPAEAELFEEGTEGIISSGTVRQGILLDISGEKNGFLEIADSPFLIQGSSVAESDRWYRNDTNLCPYAENLTTNDRFALYMQDGTEAAVIEGVHEFKAIIWESPFSVFNVKGANTVWDSRLVLKFSFTSVINN